jgi:hypothetical protein
MDRATSRTFVEKSISMSGCFLSVIESMKLLVATLISSIQSEGTSNEKVLFPFTRITGGMSSISPVLLVIIGKSKKQGFQRLSNDAWTNFRAAGQSFIFSSSNISLVCSP